MSDDAVIATIEALKTFYAGELDLVGQPLWHHPVRVMARLPAQVDDGERLVALLHDVVYRELRTLHELRCMGYDQFVRDGVAAVTKSQLRGQTYLEWLDTIVRTGEAAYLRVKIADLEDNICAYAGCDTRDAVKALARFERGRQYLLKQRSVPEAVAGVRCGTLCREELTALLVPVLGPAAETLFG